MVRSTMAAESGGRRISPTGRANSMGKGVEATHLVEVLTKPLSRIDVTLIKLAQSLIEFLQGVLQAQRRFQQTLHGLQLCKREPGAHPFPPHVIGREIRRRATIGQLRREIKTLC